MLVVFRNVCIVTCFETYIKWVHFVGLYFVPSNFPNVSHNALRSLVLNLNLNLSETFEMRAGGIGSTITSHRIKYINYKCC